MNFQTTATPFLKTGLNSCLAKNDLKLVSCLHLLSAGVTGVITLLAYEVLGTTQGFVRVRHTLPTKLHPQSLFLENR